MMTTGSEVQFDLSQLAAHFPFSQHREGQREAIEFTARAFNDGKDIVILEAPTGSGKSAIGWNLMSMVPKSYYLTVTKMLQDQLVNEFGGDLVELKGRGSYPCTWYDRFGPQLVTNRIWTQQQLDKMRTGTPNCAEGYCRTDCKGVDRINPHKCTSCFLSDHGSGKKTGTLRALPPGMKYSACPYYEQVYRASIAPKVVMNFSSFLYQTVMTNRFDVPRDLMCIDESHQVEQVLLDFVSMSLSDRLLRKAGVDLPHFETALEYAIWFAQNRVDTVLGELYKTARRVAEESDDPAARKLAVREQDDISRTLRRYGEFMDQVQQDGEWVCEVESKGSSTKGSKDQWRTVTLKPVLIRRFVRPLLLARARKTLMMSATILNVGVFCDALGIDQSRVAVHRSGSLRVATYRMKNRFPVELRPIYVEPCAKITGGKEKQHEWGPAVVQKVDEIVSRYPESRGIIHTHNFAIADMLLEFCSAESRGRMLYQRRFLDKTAMLQHHGDQSNSVIVAPAMHEGVDLYGDLSRFQIICKVPYPNFYENKQLRRRMEIDGRYMTWLTALKLVQCYGRSIRSKEDWADTFIIDQEFVNFARRAQQLLPAWFLEAIVHESPGDAQGVV